MESILVRALESKLKYWLRSFSREQFKLQGRSVNLYNLDLNGDVLHAAIGLPPTLRVAQARVRKFELKLPSLTLVNSEPIIIEIDQLDLVLVETSGTDRNTSRSSLQPSTPSKTGGGYGFADKIADGMTIAVGTVNLMLETRGGSGRDGAAWNPPLASITIRGLLLYTTNEHFRVVNLKEARDYSAMKQCIYVFKKLEWESISVDLLPHPDMFADDTIEDTDVDATRDDAGAKRRFFGGERFLDNISGEAYITIHRTEGNYPLAMEVQVQIPEALCPALSEPGLRALLRFMTGVYVCLNRGDVGSRAEQSDEESGSTLVKVTVNHIFLCIQDADFQLELLMQSLTFIRASSEDVEESKAMSRLELGHMFLRDAHSKPTCTLVQPSLRNDTSETLAVPSFASEKSWPRVYPLDDQLVTRDATPMLCIFSSQTTPAPRPPHLASQTVVQCQPLTINLQEESCIRIASFLADGVVVERGIVRPETSLNAVYISLKEFDLTIPLKQERLKNETSDGFTGARLHVEGFMICQSPFLTFKLLNLEEDPACFAFWKGQPVDSSQQRWMVRATYLSIALETGSCDDRAQNAGDPEWAAGLWRCIVMKEPCIEAAMVTGDGKALITVPPPGGIVRLGISCRSYVSNTSSEQLFFVLKMYRYLGDVSQTLVRVSKGLESEQTVARSKGKKDVRLNLERTTSLGGLAKLAPDDSAVILRLGRLEFKMLESIPGQVAVEGPPLVLIAGHGVSLRATHRMLGGAAVLSSDLACFDFRVECPETDLEGPMISEKAMSDSFVELNGIPRASSIRGRNDPSGNGRGLIDSSDGHLISQSRHQAPSNAAAMRSVLWIGAERGSMAAMESASGGQARPKRGPFLDVNIVHVIPLKKEDADCYNLTIKARVAGVRMGGGLVYTEALLHRFGVLGPDGNPGEEIKRFIETISSGPLAELLKPSRNLVQERQKADEAGWDMGKPDSIDVDLQLVDWIFALEGLEGTSPHQESVLFSREQRCWHSTFRCLRVLALSRQSKTRDSGFDSVDQGPGTAAPVQEITMQIEGLQTFKPQHLQSEGSARQEPGSANAIDISDNTPVNSECDNLEPVHLSVTSRSGVDFAANLIENVENNGDDSSSQHWLVESIQFSVKEPMDMKATKAEVEYLIKLGKLEVESASRTAAGILKLLKLHGPFGQSAIDQLQSIGNGSLEGILSPNKSNATQSFSNNETSSPAAYKKGRERPSIRKMEPTLNALQSAIANSRSLCADLETSMSGRGSRTSWTGSGRQSKADLNDLSLVVDQLRHMEALLSNLREDIT